MIALDPGKNLVYGAYFRGDGICQSLHVFTKSDAHSSRDAFGVVVVEKPSILNVPNTADMAEVLWTGALVAASLSSDIKDYSPAVWKGVLKKPIHHGRVWEWMTASERALFPLNTSEVISRARMQIAEKGKVSSYSHSWHNHLDALALGMFALGRIKRGGLKGSTNV